MLRRLFSKRAPLGTIDDSLERLHAADTPEKRAAEIAQLRDLLAVHHDAAGDAAQRGLLGMESRITDRFSGLVQTQLGVTNDMISELNAGIGGLQQQLGEMFSQTGERLDDHDTRLEAAERKLVEHDQSRDQSIEERRAIKEVVDRLETGMTAFIASSEEEALRYRALLEYVEQLREREQGKA